MAWDLSRVAPPWDPEQPSLYGFVAERLDEHGSLGLTPPTLPDEVIDPSSVSFGAGTLDGISRHFGVAAAEDEIVTSIVNAVVALARRATSRSAARLYELVTETRTLEYVDRVLTFLPSSGAEPARIARIGNWLATGGRDRSGVKFGIALLGTHITTSQATLLTLGAHDEFSLYAAVALSNSGAGDRGIFELAKRVHGWGRIECVERLTETTDPEIKRWMLVEGFKNSVMDEYLAQICARTGGLLDALEAAAPDDELVSAAGEMLAAIVVGQPGPPPADYGDLVPALHRYLALITERRGSLEERHTVRTIRRFLDDPDEVTIGCGDHEAMVPLADEFLRRPHFIGLAEAGLDDPDHAVYWRAKGAATDLGIDIYDATYNRIRDDVDEHPPWFDLLRATDEARLDRTLEVGRSKLDLSTLVTGPGHDIGLGSGYEADGALDYFLQELRRFPGAGWDFITAGLRNRVVRNRNMAIRALQEWPRERWPDDAESALRSLIAAEVNNDVRTFAADVLRGDVPVDEAWRRALADLEQRSPALGRLATALAATPQGRRLRVAAGFGRITIWDGAYDTSPMDHRHVVVTGGDDGFRAHISDDAPTRPKSAGWSHEEAIAKIAALMNRLLTD